MVWIMKLAFLDHKDSFTYNLVALLEMTLSEAEVRVFSPESHLKDIQEFQPTHLVIGPGPGCPQDYPLLKKALHSFEDLPILGICLGMQAINEYFEGKTIRSPSPVHGKIHTVIHNHSNIFQGIPEAFLCMRYHSLQIEPSPRVEVIAYAGEVPMAMKVRDKEIYGFQFHPESFGSEYGSALIRNTLVGALDV